MGEWLQIVVTIMLSMMAGVGWLAFRYPNDYLAISYWIHGASIAIFSVYMTVVLLLKEGAWSVFEFVPYEKLDAFNARVDGFEVVPMGLCFWALIVFNIFVFVIGMLSAFLNRSEGRPSDE